MGKAVEITRLDRSAAELRALAVKTEDGDVVRRLLGIALLLDGWSRGEAATASGMDRQTLCDWVHRYNLSGVAGLATASRSGRPPGLNEEQMAELKDIVIQGPDPEKDGVVRRLVTHSVPPRVDYELTAAGNDLVPVMQAMCDWGSKYLGVIPTLPRAMAVSA